ncbi:ankyrin repeat-containing domain protein [Neocallimastix sp. 'constans']
MNNMIVRCLIEDGAEINIRNKNSDTPLHIACNFKKGEEDISIRDNFDNKIKRIPLNYPYINNNDFIIEYLKENGDHGYYEKMEYDETPLYMACFKGDSILIKYLVENGANINAVDKYAKLPFIYLKNDANINASDKYKNGADVNTTKFGGFSSLLFTFWENDSNMIKYLVEKAKPIPLKKKEEEEDYNFIQIVHSNPNPE